MTDKELRELQDRFLELLTASGFYSRNADGMTVPLFDKASPNTIQVQRDLWPAYVPQFKDYIRRAERRGQSITKRQTQPVHIQSGRSKAVDQGRPETQKEASRSVRPVLRANSTRQVGEEMPKVPGRRLLTKRPAIQQSR